jgi:GNAT superfamily N-acetyltransferase
VNVREARSEDVEAAVLAYESSWDAALAPLIDRRLGDLVSFEDRVASFHEGLAKTSADAKVWVAELDGEIVGVAVYARTEAETGELRALYVVPDAWGTGAAQELMNAALAEMRSAGLRLAVLWVVEENARARRFYEREGWSADGVTRETPIGPSEARYRLELS